jgi:hypothetical protein
MLLGTFKRCIRHISVGDDLPPDANNLRICLGLEESPAVVSPGTPSVDSYDDDDNAAVADTIQLPRPDFLLSDELATAAIAIYFLGSPVNCVYVARARLPDEFSRCMFDSVIDSHDDVFTGDELRALVFFACDRDGNTVSMPRADLEEFYVGSMITPSSNSECLLVRKKPTAELQQSVYEWCVKNFAGARGEWPDFFPEHSHCAQAGPICPRFRVRRVCIFNVGESYELDAMLSREDFHHDDFKTERVAKLSCANDSAILVLHPWAYTHQSERAEGGGGFRVYRASEVPTGFESQWALLCSPEAHLPQNARRVTAAMSCCTFFARPFAASQDTADDFYCRCVLREFCAAGHKPDSPEFDKEFCDWIAENELSYDDTMPVLERLWMYKQLRMKRDPLDMFSSMDAFDSRLPAFQDSGVVPEIKNVFVSTSALVFSL